MTSLTSLRPAQALPASLRPVPYMGVIYVVAEAMKLGFYNGHPDWCNLGQGQPEVGPIPGAPARVAGIALQPDDHAYGPIGGTDELRAAIAGHYNRLYRTGKRSQYTAANVSVASGGRLALTRIFAALGDVGIGYQVPDYTAYEDMMASHLARLSPHVVPARERDGFHIPPADLEEEIVRRGLGAFLISNPCNPTGYVIRGGELQAYVEIARRRGIALVLDEFYSHFIYDAEPGADGPVSAAAHVEDVDGESVLLVDGLTKSFRYPGWRVGWVVGPAPMIEIINRAASAIDGGPSRPMQRAAIQVLEPARADQESEAVRGEFVLKRDLMVRRLREMNIRCAAEPTGTFYCWASLDQLPLPLRSGERFFREALKHRVMTVPGVFFDVNPGRRRRESRFDHWARFSFGPPREFVATGLDRLEAMIAGAGVA